MFYPSTNTVTYIFYCIILVYKLSPLIKKRFFKKIIAWKKDIAKNVPSAFPIAPRHSSRLCDNLRSHIPPFLLAGGAFARENKGRTSGVHFGVVNSAKRGRENVPLRVEQKEAILDFHVTSEKLKLKILSFYFHLVKDI